MTDGCQASELARLLGVGLITLQRWLRQFAGDGDGVDCRKCTHLSVGGLGVAGPMIWDVLIACEPLIQNTAENGLRARPGPGHVETFGQTEYR